jgi:hypothetical protein
MNSNILGYIKFEVIYQALLKPEAFKPNIHGNVRGIACGNLNNPGAG